MEDFIGRKEHEEFVKRIEEEIKRQNRRIELLEEYVGHMQALTISVEKMALTMENMLQEQQKQGKQIEALEGVPKKNWDSLKGGIIGALATAIGGAIVALFKN